MVGATETPELFLRGLYETIRRYGTSGIVFVDKGPGFVDHDAIAVVQGLPALLIHGQTAYPEGHGKIEKFNQTALAAVLRHLPGRADVDPSFGALEGFRVTSDDAALEAKLLRVYASLWRREAFLEREWAAIDHARAAMAVLLSPAFEGELANAVAVTVPRQGGVDVVLNAQQGDRLVTNPTAGDVPEELRWRLDRPPPGTVVARSPAGPVFLAPSPYASLLGPLAQAVASIHADFTEQRRRAGDRAVYGIDIELKVISGPSLVLKQARLLAAPRPN